MSQVLKEMPTWAEDVDALGRPAKYPWRDWLDGETHLLVRTTDEYEGDYQTESRFFRHTVIRAAEKRGLKVFVTVHAGRNYEDNRDRMLVKATGPNLVFGDDYSFAPKDMTQAEAVGWTK